MHSPLKIVCWNINGLRALIKKNISVDADIVCLNELRIDEQTYVK